MRSNTPTSTPQLRNCPSSSLRRSSKPEVGIVHALRRGGGHCLMADFYSLMDYAARQRVVAGGLASSRLDAVLITHLPNIRYLCGFSGTAGLLVVPSSGKSAKPTFYTDGRYAQQATDEVQGVKVVITKKAALIEACAAISRSRIKVLGFEAAHLTYSVHQQINQALRGKVRLKAVDGQVELLRLNKGPAEIEQIRAS